MDMLHFEWDPQKDLTNQKKHGVSFAEASTVFEDVNALVINDPEHSEDEERFVILEEPLWVVTRAVSWAAGEANVRNCVIT